MFRDADVVCLCLVCILGQFSIIKINIKNIIKINKYYYSACHAVS